MKSKKLLSNCETLKNGRALDPNNIHTEMIKVDPYFISSTRKTLLTDTWPSERITLEWKVGFSIKIPKKGHYCQCTNWRGITLLNTVVTLLSKIVAIIIQKRESNALDSILRKEQVGFWLDWSCLDHMNRQVEKKYNVQAGVKQGCILFPSLFTIVSDWVRKKSRKHCCVSGCESRQNSKLIFSYFQ